MRRPSAPWSAPASTEVISTVGTQPTSTSRPMLAAACCSAAVDAVCVSFAASWSPTTHILSIERLCQSADDVGQPASRCRRVTGSAKCGAHTAWVRRFLCACITFVALATLAGCAGAPAPAATGTPLTSPTTPATTGATAIATPATASQALIILEPNQGMGAIYALLASAHHFVDLTMYELEDTSAE